MVLGCYNHKNIVLILTFFLNIFRMFNLESDKQLQRIVNANRSKEIFR